MSNDVANVLSGKPKVTGGIFRAPLGTTMPTNATDPLDAAFQPIGYVGEDGVTETIDRSVNKIKAWGGDIVKVVQTETSTTYEFAAIEAANVDSLEMVYGADNVDVSGDTIEVKVTGEQLEHACYVLEMKDGPADIRIAIADGQVTETGETVYNDEDVIGHPVTVEAFTDPSTGAKALKFIDLGTTPAAPVIASVSPSTVGTAGGDLVILTGIRFTGATAVEIDGTPVTSADWEVLSDTKIALVTPADTAGTYDVEVTAPSGTSAAADITYA